jgi:hypothetical protein
MKSDMRFDSAFLAITLPNYFHNRSELESLLDTMDVGDRDHGYWLDELAADMVATEILFDSLCLEANIPKEVAAANLCGGLAAACETLYQLEIAIIGWGNVITPNHPPAYSMAHYDELPNLPQ